MGKKDIIMIKRIIIRSVVSLALLSGFLFSCTDSMDNDGSGKRGEIVKPGVYSGEIVFTAEEGGENNEVTSRGIDESQGHFTNEYPYDVIYIHSADNKEIGEGHQVLELPLESIEECGDDCKGVRFDMEVHDGGSYTLTKNGNSITIQSEDSVYFSSLSTPYWEADVAEDKTPLTQSDLFIDSEANQQELLRSKSYDVGSLVTLLYATTPEILLSRHTSAFRAYLEFTYIPEEGEEVENENVISISSREWRNELGGAYDDFYIKLYMGPNFCHKFDVYNQTVVPGDEGGYYATNTQRYQSFESVLYTFTGASMSETYSYSGFGYQTADNYFLFSPLNLNTLDKSFRIYCFVKYSAEDHAEGDEFWTSDEGAKWFYVDVDANLQRNRVNFIALLFDFRDLKIFVDEAKGTSTDSYVRNAWSGNGPEKIDIKPIKIIYQ